MGDFMLNKEQYKALKNMFKEIKKNMPGKSVIGHWELNALRTTKENRNIIKTINSSPIDPSLKKFSRGNMINIDGHLIEMITEYEEKHNWKTSTVILITVIGTIVGIAVGILSVLAFFNCSN